MSKTLILSEIEAEIIGKALEQYNKQLTPGSVPSKTIIAVAVRLQAARNWRGRGQR
jgi:hypothetical protein